MRAKVPKTLITILHWRKRIVHCGNSDCHHILVYLEFPPNIWILNKRIKLDLIPKLCSGLSKVKRLISSSWKSDRVCGFPPTQSCSHQPSSLSPNASCCNLSCRQKCFSLYYYFVCHCVQLQRITFLCIVPVKRFHSKIFSAMLQNWTSLLALHFVHTGVILSSVLLNWGRLL